MATKYRFENNGSFVVFAPDSRRPVSLFPEELEQAASIPKGSRTGLNRVMTASRGGGNNVKFSLRDHPDYGEYERTIGIDTLKRALREMKGHRSTDSAFDFGHM